MIQLIPEQSSAENDPSLHLAFLPPFHPLRYFPALLLCHGCHKRQPDLSVIFSCIDVVKNKKYTHAKCAQCAHGNECIYGISRETADFFR